MCLLSARCSSDLSGCSCSPQLPEMVVSPRTSSHLLVSSPTYWHCPQGCSPPLLLAVSNLLLHDTKWASHGFLCPKSITLLSSRPRHLLSETPVSQLQSCLTLSSSLPAHCSLCLRYPHPSQQASAPWDCPSPSTPSLTTLSPTPRTQQTACPIHPAASESLISIDPPVYLAAALAQASSTPSWLLYPKPYPLILFDSPGYLVLRQH